MDHEPLPPIGEWILSSKIIPAGNGFRVRVNKVLHRCDGAMSFVVHSAYVHNGKWAYERGDYYATEEEARAGFLARF